MLEEEKNIADMYKALTAYLNAHPWSVADIDVLYTSLGFIGDKDQWSVKEFFERWTKQANYPTLRVVIEKSTNSDQTVFITQERALNSKFSIFAGDLLYPSPFGEFIWYVPLQCSFGTGATNGNSLKEATFYVDTKNFTAVLPKSDDGLDWLWVHCDRKFTGYYETDYTEQNWEYLGSAMKLKNNEFNPEDRANIIHNLFLNSFTERTSYCILRDVLSYLEVERDYLPWRTVHKHLTDMTNVLHYKKEFIDISTYFIALLRTVEDDIKPWEPAGNHIEELLKETILSLSCLMQDSQCLNKASDQFGLASQSGNLSNSVLPSYMRKVVYNYHIQNTYRVSDWTQLLQYYEFYPSPQDQHKFLEALTFTRLPWLIAQFRVAQASGELNRVDFFETLKMLSVNPTGREIIWDYFRINFGDILNFYGEEDPRIGTLLVDIVSSFENEFLFYELLEFVFYTNTGATANARFKALEIVSTTVQWVMGKEQEISDAFSGGVCKRRNIDEQSKQMKFIEKAQVEVSKKFPKRSY
jgi:aminopeptidase N